MNKPTITIAVVSDVVCPWCYIGKRRLERAIRETSAEFDFKVSFLPFELNPNMPLEGASQRDYLTAKFGNAEQYEKITKHVSSVAAEEGLAFNFAIQNISPNTFTAHRLIWMAGLLGKQIELKEALMKAYFEEGKNLSDNLVVTDIAVSAGLNREEVEKVLNSNLYSTEVKRSQEASHSRGISGVPFFIINNQYGISGAQPTDVLKKVFGDVAKESQP